MAFKEVVPPKDTPVGEFFQFKAIGDKLRGYFVGAGPAKGSYAKPTDVAVSFLCSENGKPVVKTISPAPYTLKRAVQHAMGEGKLVQGVECQVHYTGNQPIEGRDSAMKLIKTEIDLDDAGKPRLKPGILEAIKKHANAAPAAPAKPKGDDLFGDSDGGEIPF
jgi:hypothetical protein